MLHESTVFNICLILLKIISQDLWNFFCQFRRKREEDYSKTKRILLTFLWGLEKPTKRQLLFDLDYKYRHVCVVCTLQDRVWTTDQWIWHPIAASLSSVWLHPCQEPPPRRRRRQSPLYSSNVSGWSSLPPATRRSCCSFSVCVCLHPPPDGAPEPPRPSHFVQTTSSKFASAKTWSAEFVCCLRMLSI